MHILDPSALNGALICGLGLLLFALTPLKIRLGFSKSFQNSEPFLSGSLLALFLGFALIYLFFPNYADHAEASVAAFGLILRHGDALYPWPDVFPYHGCVYGPGLAVLQALASTLGSNGILRSKLPGVLALGVSILLFLKSQRHSLARGYLLYLWPFSLYVFWNRADPILLGLVCVSIYLLQRFPNSKLNFAAMGVLGGLASVLKLHGVVYVAAACLAVKLSEKIRLSDYLIFGAAAALTFFAFFLLPGVSFGDFLEYCHSVSHHGLSLETGLDNFIYLLFLSSPILLLNYGRKWDFGLPLNLFLFLLCEITVSVVAAKPGSGYFHLLPFIPANAQIMEGILRRRDANTVAPRLPPIRFIYAVLMIVSLFAVKRELFPILKHWPDSEASRAELLEYTKHYPDLTMGLTDRDYYPYSFLQVLLPRPQIDYQGYMALQFSGVGDQDFVQALSNGSITHLLMPVRGHPYEMVNYYTDKPLFSDAVRQAFAKNYRAIESGPYYAVYAYRH
jgi:hypothetical protein